MGQSPARPVSVQHKRLFSHNGSKQDITVGYACAYPFAILSVIGVILGLKKLFGVNLAQEDKYWEEAQQVKNRAPIYYHVKTTNKALQGITLREIREIIGRPFICSRVMHDGTDYQSYRRQLYLFG